MNRNILLSDCTLYLAIGYFKLWICNRISHDTNQILYESENTACIEFGSDLATFLEALRNSFESRYIEQKPYTLDQIIKRTELKICVTVKAIYKKDETFFKLSQKETDIEIIALKRKNDLLQLMNVLRESLIYGIFFKIDEIKIGQAYLKWLKTFEGEESNFCDLSCETQTKVIEKVIKTEKFSKDYENKVYTLLSFYSDYLSTIGLIDLELQADPGEFEFCDVSGIQ